MPLVDSQYYPTIVISNNVILFNHYAEVQLFSLHLETELMQQPCGLIHHYSFSPVTFNSVNRAGEVHRGEMTGIRPAARGGGEQGRARNFTWSDLGWNPQLCHLPAVDGNLGNLLTNLRLCIIV